MRMNMIKFYNSFRLLFKVRIDLQRFFERIIFLTSKCSVIVAEDQEAKSRNRFNHFKMCFFILFLWTIFWNENAPDRSMSATLNFNMNLLLQQCQCRTYTCSWRRRNPHWPGPRSLPDHNVSNSITNRNIFIRIELFSSPCRASVPASYSPPPPPLRGRAAAGRTAPSLGQTSYSASELMSIG